MIIILLLILAVGCPLAAAASERSAAPERRGVVVTTFRAYALSMFCALVLAVLLFVAQALIPGIGSDMGAGFDFAVCVAFSIPACFIVYPIVFAVLVESGVSPENRGARGMLGVALAVLVLSALVIPWGEAGSVGEVITGLLLFVGLPATVWRLYALMYQF